MQKLRVSSTSLSTHHQHASKAKARLAWTFFLIHVQGICLQCNYPYHLCFLGDSQPSPKVADFLALSQHSYDLQICKRYVTFTRLNKHMPIKFTNVFVIYLSVWLGGYSCSVDYCSLQGVSAARSTLRQHIMHAKQPFAKKTVFYATRLYHFDLCLDCQMDHCLPLLRGLGVQNSNSCAAIHWYPQGTTKRRAGYSVSPYIPYISLKVVMGEASHGSIFQQTAFSNRSTIQLLVPLTSSRLAAAVPRRWPPM